MLALLHFWAGPLSTQPTLEETMTDKAVSLRDAAIAALKGEAAPVPEPPPAAYDLDRIASILTSALGGLAIILGVVGFALRQPKRVAGGAALLGAGALTFQFAFLILGVIALVALLSVLQGDWDFG